MQFFFLYNRYNAQYMLLSIVCAIFFVDRLYAVAVFRPLLTLNLKTYTTKSCFFRKKLYDSTSCCISHGPCHRERTIFDPPQLRNPSTDFRET